MSDQSKALTCECEPNKEILVAQSLTYCDILNLISNQTLRLLLNFLAPSKPFSDSPQRCYEF